MAEVFIALQTPEVELPIISKKDCTGKTAKIIAGFKRHNSAVADEKVAEFEAILADKESDQGATLTKLQNFLKGEILYLLDVDLFVRDSAGKLVKRTVRDTRKEKDDEELWGTADNCLDFLLDLLLAATPWSPSFTQAFYAVSQNMDLRNEADIKN